MTSITSSASRCSDIAVNPLTSANRTVTWRRRPSGVVPSWRLERGDRGVDHVVGHGAAELLLGLDRAAELVGIGHAERDSRTTPPAWPIASAASASDGRVRCCVVSARVRRTGGSNAGRRAGRDRDHLRARGRGPAVGAHARRPVHPRRRRAARRWRARSPTPAGGCSPGTARTAVRRRSCSAARRSRRCRPTRSARCCATSTSGPTVIAGGSGGARVSLLTAARNPDVTAGLAMWWISGGVPGLLQLANYYCMPSADAAWHGGMEAVVALDQWQETIAKNPRNRDRFLAMDRERVPGGDGPLGGGVLPVRRRARARPRRRRHRPPHACRSSCSAAARPTCRTPAPRRRRSRPGLPGRRAGRAAVGRRRVERAPGRDRARPGRCSCAGRCSSPSSSSGRTARSANAP